LELEIDTPLKRDNGIDTPRHNCSNAIALFESYTDINKLELEIDTPLKRDNGIYAHRHNGFNAIALFETPTFSSRDRDIGTTPPLRGGTVPNLAGQASAARKERNELNFELKPHRNAETPAIAQIQCKLTSDPFERTLASGLDMTITSKFESVIASATQSQNAVEITRLDQEYYQFYGFERGMHGFEHIGVYDGTNNEFYHLHGIESDATTDTPHHIDVSDLLMMTRDNYDSSEDTLSPFSPRDRDIRSEPLPEGGTDPNLAGQASVDRTHENPAILVKHVSPFNPRDRDIHAKPPPEGGTVLNLAGQASADRTYENPDILVKQMPAHGLPRVYRAETALRALRKHEATDVNWLHASYYEYPLAPETNQEHLQIASNLGNDITLLHSDTNQTSMNLVI
jgi:hypothetical protein